MAEFNLIGERWIPCIVRDGNLVEFGIRDTLLKAQELREICDDSPLVTVGIHRLLLAILFRAFAGPADFVGWMQLFGRGAFDADAVGRYLEAWRGGFDLFEGRRPFYQMAELTTNRSASVSRLATEVASGNNATLFDHCVDDGDVQWTPAKTARSLVSCQSFALGFGRSGNASIKGVEEALPYSADGIALRGMSVWLQGANLFETLMVNLAPREDNSLPPWELADPNLHRDRVQGKGRRAVLSYGAVDRFTWQSRLIRLIPNDDAVLRMHFTQGRSADKTAGDPMKVYRTSKEEGVTALALGSGKAAWRDAHAILTIPAAKGDERRPECFNLISRARSAGIVDPAKHFVAQIVGLASAPNKAGKFLLWRHERMPVPAALLSDRNLIERLGSLVQIAEKAAFELNSRTRRIAKLYLAPDSESPAGRKPDKGEVNKVVDAIDPRAAYWARLERHFFNLLENLPEDWDEANDYWKPEEQQTATRRWRDCVKLGATRALEESIQSLGTTARAIQAVARVRTDFRDDDLNPPAPKADKAKDKGGETER